jgi:endoglucanase
MRRFESGTRLQFNPRNLNRLRGLSFFCGGGGEKFFSARPGLRLGLDFRGWAGILFVNLVSVSVAPSSSGLGHQILNLGTRVRFPLGLPVFSFMRAMTNPPVNVLPRWRGFNLLCFFSRNRNYRPVPDEFRWIADWGFDFVRLPLCYTLWTDDNDPGKVHEEMLAQIDRAVELGREHGLHVNLAFHRAPGYSVNTERVEPFNLWKDRAALDAFCFHWQLFARRYRGIPPAALSFNLVNEPPAVRDGLMSRSDHEHVVRTVTHAIRAVDPDRLIIADGLDWGNEPAPELADLGIAQSCRGYLPLGVSHYRASWVGGERFPEPVWPGGEHFGQPWDRARLERHYDVWATLFTRGVGAHCGECGFYNRTPHPVGLAWLRDVLAVLASRGIGFALWNLRGTFGILDSGRDDVDGEDWYGHKLDRQLLELLRQS